MFDLFTGEMTEQIGSYLRHSGQVWWLVSVSLLKMITIKTDIPIGDHPSVFEFFSYTPFFHLFSGEAELTAPG